MTTLFDRPVAHARDPQTSYDAGQKLLDSGKLNDQEYEVYVAIKNYGGENFTAKELSEKSGLNYWTIQRRLSGLYHKGKIERINQRFARRDGCCVWRLKQSEVLNGNNDKTKRNEAQASGQ